MTLRRLQSRSPALKATALLIAMGSVVQCRVTTLDVLSPPMQAADASLGGAPPDTKPPPDCADGIATNEECEFSSQCCSGLCNLDYNAELTCRPTPGCLGVGRPCSLAAECCSLACAVEDAGTGTCSESTLCSVLGGPCLVSSDCCSNLCEAGQCIDPGPTPPGPRCSPAGEACSTAEECCAGVCSANIDERERCLMLPGCRPQRELCVIADDCCSGVCTPEKSGVSRCTPTGPCTPGETKPCNARVGDLCDNSDQCCSHVCIPTSDGVNRCAPAPGCRPACDTCQQNSDCCSNECAADAQGLLRCVDSGTCLPEGETCSRDDQCCQSEGKTRCAEEPKGLKGKRCVLDGPGVACLDDGAACALASRCCGGSCVPSPAGGFVCTSQCVKENQPCTSRADCCSSSSSVDCLAVGGQRVCRELIR